MLNINILTVNECKHCKQTVNTVYKHLTFNIFVNTVYSRLHLVC